MGCDIHMFVEYKTGEGKWINGDYFKRNIYFKENDESEDEDYRENEFSVIELHGDRNYSLFSTLAKVRDYSGKVIPVAEPKYLPDDMSSFVKKEAKGWEGDAHSHSWLTLKELKEYQSKSPKITYSGLISSEQQKQLDDEGITPNSWCQGTNQEGFERREWSEENNTLVPLISKLEKRIKELIQYDWQDYNPENDEKIRIVFWFDN